MAKVLMMSQKVFEPCEAASVTILSAASDEEVDHCKIVTSGRMRLISSANMQSVSKQRAVCTTCGAQYAGTSSPERCIICDEERQYVGHNGQQWSTPEQVLNTHKNTWTDVEPGVYAIGVEPKFGIGQHCYLITTGQQARYCSAIHTFAASNCQY